MAAFKQTTGRRSEDKMAYFHNYQRVGRSSSLVREMVCELKPDKKAKQWAEAIFLKPAELELEKELQRARDFAAATRSSFVESLLKRDVDDSGRLAGPKA